MRCIRKAEHGDLGAVEQIYKDIFAYEREHGAYTVWREGIYPTGQTAADAIARGCMAVSCADGQIEGSIIMDCNPPAEYASIGWRCAAAADEVLVVHLLCVRPDRAGHGAGKALVAYAVETARRQHCKAVRLDTGLQNTPAVRLYTKMGFEVAGVSSMTIGGKIPHSGHVFLELVLT